MYINEILCISCSNYNTQSLSDLELFVVEVMETAANECLEMLVSTMCVYLMCVVCVCKLCSVQHLNLSRDHRNETMEVIYTCSYTLLQS